MKQLKILLPAKSQVHNNPLLWDVINVLQLVSKVNVNTSSADSSSSSSSSPVLSLSTRLGIVSTIVVVSISSTETLGPHWHSK